MLRDIQGLSTEEASAMLRVKDQTLKSRLHRGRLILRKQLADFAGGLSLHRPIYGRKTSEDRAIDDRRLTVNCSSIGPIALLHTGIAIVERDTIRAVQFRTHEAFDAAQIQSRGERSGPSADAFGIIRRDEAADDRSCPAEHRT
jgi:hypothetical protein